MPGLIWYDTSETQVKHNHYLFLNENVCHKGTCSIDQPKKYKNINLMSQTEKRFVILFIQKEKTKTNSTYDVSQLESARYWYVAPMYFLMS